MTLKVVPDPEPLVSDNVVEMLEDCLARVRSGEIRDVALAIAYTDGSPGTSWAKGQRFVPLVAAASALHFRLTQMMMGYD